MAMIIWFIAFISLFALSVLFHELGHFIFSKIAGIKVYEFSIGLPFIPRLATVFEYKETKFTLKIIPVGGFISYTPIDRKESESLYDFLKYDSWRKLMATLGGPIFNFLFAYILVAVIMMQGTYVPSMEIEDIIPESQAALKGLQKKDILAAFNDINVNDWEILKEIIVKNGQNPLKISYKRNNVMYETYITPDFDQKRQEVQLGIAPAYIFYQYSFSEALQKSSNFMKKIFIGFFDLIKKMMGGKASPKDFSGPVGIAKITKKAMDKGNKTYWMLLAFFSINLGIINLLPLPALDGGQLIAYTIETVTRRTFSLKVHQIFGMLGMLVILSIMLLVMYSDILTYWFSKGLQRSSQALNKNLSK
ncbi:MAG: site-2 protease family protein [Candidatus Firestonebacteria bacterium]|nr:site-2 protease family protein [Candidatus Firestonebacteria bacterium]